MFQTKQHANHHILEQVRYQPPASKPPSTVDQDLQVWMPDSLRPYKIRPHSLLSKSSQPKAQDLSNYTASMTPELNAAKATKTVKARDIRRALKKKDRKRSQKMKNVKVTPEDVAKGAAVIKVSKLQKEDVRDGEEG